MQSSIVDITAYGIIWLLFGLLHSCMAAQTFKEPWRRILGPLAGFERLLYNGISVVAISAVLSFARHNLAPNPIFQPSTVLQLFIQLVQGGGVVLLVWSFTAYDPWRFIGLRQLVAGFRKRKIGEESMVFSLPHQFIRHPLYSGALLILWFRPMSEAVLVTNLFATIYLLIGLRWEESRLLALYGAEYDRYRQTVPALIPSPSRRWKPE